MDKAVSYQKCNNANEAYQEVKKAITPETIEKFKVSAELDYDDASRQVKASGKGFELMINFTDTEAQVQLSLSLMLRPFKSKILEGLEKQLKRIV